jgi:dephospho-CoA kinase
MKFVTIIGLCGKAGSGKSTVAQYLQENYGFEKIAFADSLKEMLLKSGIVTLTDLDKKTPYTRFLLQRIGTDIMRNQVNPDYWVNKTLVRIGELISKGKKKIVIDDIRFLNEAELVDLYNGVIIKINRNNNGILDNENLKNHESELFTDQIPADFIINNTGTIDDLCKKIDNIILKIQEDND